jgi:HSP20 family protein
MAISIYRNYPSVFEGIQRLNRMLDEAFSVWPQANAGAVTSAWFPPTDVSEDKDGLQITMELPGVRSEDVKLSLENNVLTVRGEKRQESEEQTDRVHRYERSYGTFERSFALPSTVDPEKVDARYENGVLVINIPKAERARPREIPVNSGIATTAARVSKTSQGSQASGPSRPAQNRDPEEEGSAAKQR